MDTKIVLLPAIGVVLASGCAGPLNKRWDDPVYRSLQEQFTEHDRAVAQSPDEAHSLPVFGLETLESLSVEDAIRVAIENSPQLRSAGYQVDAASGRVLQAGLYPNPTFNFGGESLGAKAGNGGETAYVLEQEIVLGGKLDRARDVAEADRLSARAEFVAEEFAVASRVSRAYYRGVSAQERLIKREELLDLASQLLEAAKAKVEAGSATKPEELRAEVVYEQALIELEAAQFDVRASKQTLASVIGVEGVVDLPLTSPVASFPQLPSREELLETTLKANSRISIARLAIERAKQAHRLAKAQAAPDLVASVGPRYSDIDNESTFDLGIGLEIPLFDRNQGEIQATLAERLSASAQLRTVQLELLAEVSDAWARYESAFSAANRYRENLLPKAERTLKLTREAYQSSKADYLRLLDAQQVVIEARITYVNTLEQLHSAAAVLNELTQTKAPWRNPRDEDQNLPNSEVNQ